MSRFYINDGARPGRRTPVIDYATRSNGVGSNVLNEAQAIARGRKLVATDAGTPTGVSRQLVPQMTGYTTPAGVASASYEQFPQWYPAWAAFDKSLTVETSAWNNAISPTVGNPASWHWLKYDFGAGNAPYLTGYIIGARNNSPHCAPQVWCVQGSNNDTDWLDLETDRTKVSWVAQETAQYELTAPGTYRYVRIVVKLGTNGSYVSVGEFQPLGIPKVAPTAYTDWRVSLGRPIAGANLIELAEIEMFNGPTNVAGLATITSSQPPGWGTNTAALVDGNKTPLNTQTALFWEVYSAADGWAHLDFHFASPQAIDAIKLWQTPQDNSSTWTPSQIRISRGSSPASLTQCFEDLTADPPWQTWPSAHRLVVIP